MVFADKSWLEKPRGSREFYDGVQKFVAHCTPLVNSAGKIRCPCKRCRNILFKPIEWIGDHITDNGWDPLYTVWDKHGEPALPTPPLQATPTPPPLMSDMTALLDDLSYIPPNNEHNEPTQGDIGETSNEPTQATRNEFEELYSSANEALYPGCDHVTRLDFMAKFTYFKVKGKLTDSIFNEMLEWLQYALPESKGYKFPPSYYAIKKTFKTIGLGYESIHACEHDCCLFRGEVNKDLQFCPVCNTSRWKDSDTPGKKVPRKVLRYFPIIPRLQRLYKSRHTAKDMIWHATGKCTEPGKMQHPVDGGAWKKFDMKYPDFAKEPRNVRLGLCADGFNPFGNLSQTYSMWPVILTTYNLPPWLCMKESNFMLTLLIPGPKSPGKDIDVYLRPLIEDLQVLWDKKGVETTDIVSGQNFNMRAMVLWTINDFPARSSLSGWSGQGYKACPTCNEETPSIGVKNKIAYVGHRRFLRKPHKWRSSREFNGDTDHRDPPKEYPRDVILAQHARLLTRVPGKHPKHGGVKIKRNVEVELNWTKRSIFYELEYWSFISLRHNLDIMHIEKNVLEAILNTLLMNDKSKDTAKARQDLQKLGIRRPLWLTKNHKGKIVKPQAAYSFTPENRKKFCQYIKGVKLPDGFGSCFKHKVTDNDTNITGLKSHDCHIMMQRLLPYGLQNYLPDNIAKPIIELSSLFKQLCSATLMEDDMLKASVKVVEILCELERIYPPAFFDIMIHLPIHLALEALEGGPIHPRWMFPFERFMKKLKGYVRNKAKPEGSIAEGYVAEEALTLSSHYFRDVTTKFNRLERNVDPPPPTCQFQAFRSVCNTIGLRSFPPFGAKEFNKARWYVLHNSPEIDTYRAQFQSLFPEKNMLEEFPGWFRTLLQEILEFKYCRSKVAVGQSLSVRHSQQFGRVKKLTLERTDTNHRLKPASATQEELQRSNVYRPLHTVIGCIQDLEASDDRMRELEATGEHTTAEINAMVRGEKLRGHIPGVGDRFADSFARYDSGGASESGGSRVRDSEGGEDGDDTGREDGGDDVLVVLSVIIRSFPGNLVSPWHQFLDQKIRGAHFSLGIVAGERFVIELTPSMFLQRHVAGDRFPQRHVAGEGVRMLLGKGLITVIMKPVHRARKASKLAHEDVISRMPENVITDIMNRLPIRDAMRTSILASNWRFRWTMLTELVFDQNFSKYLQGPNGEESYDERNISRILLNLIELKHLRLCNCSFHLPCSFRGYPNLLNLHLVAMSSNSHKVGKLITQCPSLEDLRISRDSSFRTVKPIEISKIGNLNLLAEAGARKDVSTTFPCLKTPGFHSIDFANDIKLSFIFEMIFRSPNLQRLEIVASTDNIPTCAEVDYNTTRRLQLRRVLLLNIKGSNNEVCFINYLLACSPLLEKISIGLNSSSMVDGADGRCKFAEKLKLHRASLLLK
ncbi:hypothetical protein Tco_0546551 [Tanacetum coccineum]